MSGRCAHLQSGCFGILSCTTICHFHVALPLHTKTDKNWRTYKTSQARAAATNSLRTRQHTHLRGASGHNDSAPQRPATRLSVQRRAREPLSANRRKRFARAATSSSAQTHMRRRGRHRTPVTPSLANRAPPLSVRVREHALALPPTCPPQHASAIVHFGANRARASSGSPPQARRRCAHRQRPHSREAATTGLALAQLPAPQGLAHIRTHRRPTLLL